MFCIAALTGVAHAQHTYSKAVQKACAKDYKAHCGQDELEREIAMQFAARQCFPETHFPDELAEHWYKCTSEGGGR
jgi:hypothetical protein